MKKLLTITLVVTLLLSLTLSATGMYSPPSRVTPTKTDLTTGQAFFNGLKWDVSKADSSNKIILTIPAMPKQYLVKIVQRNLASNFEIKGGQKLYQGTGGTTITVNIDPILITGFDFLLGNDSTSAIIARDLYTFTHGNKTVVYVPHNKCVFPDVDSNGNITGYYNLEGETVDRNGNVIADSQGNPVQTSSSKFSDVPSSHWAYKAVNTLSDNGYIKGYNDGTFKPNNNITRAEFMTMLDKFMSDKWPDGKSYTNTIGQQIVPSSHWAYNTVQDAFKFMAEGDIKRIFGGNNFDPDRKITREEVAAVLESVLSVHPNFQGKPSPISFSDINDSQYQDAVKFSLNNGLILGYPDGTFRPQNNITRAEIAALLYKVLNRF